MRPEALYEAARGVAARYCALLVDHPELWPEVTVTAATLPDPILRALFTAIEARRAEKHVDSALLVDDLAAAGLTPEQISTALEALSSRGFAAHLSDYERILRRYDDLRRLHEVQKRIGQFVADANPEGGWAELNNVARSPENAGGAGEDTMKRALWDVMAEMEEPPIVAPTGFRQIDGIFDGGLRPGEVCVLAARPGVGKSVFALQTILRLSAEKRRVGLWSLEMSPKQWSRRALSQLSGVNAKNLRRGVAAMNDAEMTAVQQWTPHLLSLPITWANPRATRPQEFRLEASRLVRSGAELLVIDYVQLMEPDPGAKSREQEVARASRAAKMAAEEYEVPVLMLAQLSRDAEDRMPTLANLRESGALEQDADIVTFLHREKDEETGNRSPDTMVIVAKNRDGETGMARLWFDGATMSFTEARP